MELNRKSPLLLYKRELFLQVKGSLSPHLRGVKDQLDEKLPSSLKLGLA